MCQRCTEYWNKYKEAKRNFEETKEAYLIQCRMGCDDKKDYIKPEEPIKLSEEHKILQSHGFLESQNKPELWFMNPDDIEEATVFIDMRKGAPRAYGFQNNANMDHEVVQKYAHKAVLELRMLTAKIKGQSELEVEQE